MDAGCGQRREHDAEAVGINRLDRADGVGLSRRRENQRIRSIERGRINGLVELNLHRAKPQRYSARLLVETTTSFDTTRSSLCVSEAVQGESARTAPLARSSEVKA